jgi:uncharacterized membrane protein YdjX (TVP38/TMEM64 family)
MVQGNKPNPARLRIVLAFGALGLFAVAGVVALAAGLSFHGLTASPDAIVRIIRSWGAWGALAAIALMIAHSFLPLPAEVIAVANGIIFGPVWGTVITWTGAMLGAWAAFGLARLFGRPLVETFVPARYRHTLDDWAETRGAMTLLILRLIPIVAFNLINYAVGLARISSWTFTWTTGLGILPMTLLMVVLGDRLASVSGEAGLVVLAGVLLAWLAVKLLRKRLPLHRPGRRSPARPRSGS